MASVNVGAIGQKIILNVGVNIAAATTRWIEYLKPDGTSSYWTAVQETTTSISYTTTAATDLDVSGSWQLQAYVVTPTWTDHGCICRLTVKATL